MSQLVEPGATAAAGAVHEVQHVSRELHALCVPNVPAGHDCAMEMAESQYWPALQSYGVEEPATQDCPGVHATMSSGLAQKKPAVQLDGTTRPDVLQCCPMVQFRQLVRAGAPRSCAASERTGAYWPAGQSTRDTPSQAIPPGHRSQCVLACVAQAGSFITHGRQKSLPPRPYQPTLQGTWGRVVLRHS